MVIALIFSSPLLIGFLLLIVLLALSSSWTVASRARGASYLPYLAREWLLSPSERLLYVSLSQALVPDFHLFPKVRLEDVFVLHRGLGRRAQDLALERIREAEADFVVCDPSTLRILGIIALEKSTDLEATAREQIQLINAALATAGLPILRLVAQASYSLSSLREQAALTFRPSSADRPLVGRLP